MLSRTMLSVSIFVGTIAVGLWAWVPTASSGSPGPMEGQARYKPVQNISYEFGSKFMSGFFVQKSEACVVTLMVIEKSDPDKMLSASATRVRLVLQPGQIAGLDSEEGRSLNITCGDDATALLVDFGEREKLMALQALALPNLVAKAP
jgi:hypothetical protein